MLMQRQDPSDVVMCALTLRRFECWDMLGGMYRITEEEPHDEYPLVCQKKKNYASHGSCRRTTPILVPGTWYTPPPPLHSHRLLPRCALVSTARVVDVSFAYRSDPWGHSASRYLLRRPQLRPRPVCIIRRPSLLLLAVILRRRRTTTQQNVRTTAGLEH